MIGTTDAWQRELAVKAPALDERQLAAFLRFHEIASDDGLCDAIDIDSRARASAAKPIGLARYLEAVAGIEDRRVVLDAAIEVALRDLRRAGTSPEDAVRALKSAHPHLAPRIDTAAVFDEFLASSDPSAPAASLATAQLTLPTSVGDTGPDGQRRYMLVRLLGTGSQATVYLGTDAFLSSPDRPAWVAVKVFPRRARDEADSLAIAESRAVRRIDHPSVVHVLDRGRTDDGNEYVVFEHVEGTPLHRAVDGATMPPREAARLVASLAHGLQAAHAAGVLHRDIKPANVLLGRSGVAKLADFGLADRVRIHGPARGPAGTFAFMSPEQYRCDERAALVTSDIYALGGVLFWLLTGRSPNGTTGQEIEQRLWQGDAAPPLDPRTHRPGLDPDLAAIVRRALAPSPADRYASADMLARDLEAFLEHRPIEWTRPGPARRAALAARRAPWAAGLAALGVLAVAGASATVVGIWRASTIRELESSLALSQERAERAQAEQEAAVQRAKVEGAIQWVQVGRATLRDQAATPDEGWLRGTIVTEVLLGPVVLGVGENGTALWTQRIEIVRQILAEARAHGRAAEFEAMAWQSLLGYWLLRADRFEEAVRELETAIDLWAPRLPAEDRFLIDMRILRDAAALGVALADPGTPPEELEARRRAVEGSRDHPLPDHLRDTVDNIARGTAEPTP